MTLTFEHITQQGNGWRNDCGPADVLMWLRALGLAKTTTPRWIAERVDPTQDGTDAASLVRAFALFKVPAAVGEVATFPRIEIIDYGMLPESVKAPGYESASFLHWILRDRENSYFDPIHTSPTRGHVSLNGALIDAAHAAGLARAKAAGYDCRHVTATGSTEQVAQPIDTDEVKPVEKTSGRAVVRWQSWNVRLTPDVDSKTGAAVGQVVDTLDNGQQFTVLRELKSGAQTFAEIDLAAGGAVLKRKRAYVLKQGTGWSYLDPVQDAQPIPAGVIGVHPAVPALPFHQRMGVHMLSAGKPQLDDWLSARCKSFTCLNNVAAAREARATGAAVIYRRFVDHGSVPGPRDFVRFMGLGAGDSVMIMGLNEADSISTSDIEKRFSWDVEFARAVWDIYPRSFPVIGSWSMGTPQIENPDVARRFRATYGKFLNENWHRVGLNYHSYSGRPDASFPPQVASVVTPEWLEMRFLKYAYDLAFGALDKRVLLVSDESGVDQQGTGGLPACGYDEATFMRWWAMRRALFEAHPQQYVFNLFQADATSARWAGYSVRGYMESLKQIWAG